MKLRSQTFSAATVLALFAALMTWMPCPEASAGVNDVAAKPAPTTEDVAFPLLVSANHRYLVDQNGVPFMIVGDSPQALIGNVPLDDAEKYIRNRAQYGINALWINLVCNTGTGCDPSGSTYDGIAPFTKVGDLATPNSDYFHRADSMINLAAANKMVVFLDPIETAGWLTVLRANGLVKAREYGEFLGNRYSSFPNIIWLHGNDFQSWRTAQDDELVQAVAKGIRRFDHVHIHTVELNFRSSGSLDDPTWAPLIDLDAAYTYRPAYAQVLTEYNRPQALPTFLVEASYEFEEPARTDGGGTPRNLRRQEYWSMLSGATGQLYSSTVQLAVPAWLADETGHARGAAVELHEAAIRNP